MKVLFVTREQGPMEDYSTMLLSAVLKKDGHNTDVVQLDKKAIKNNIRSYKPDILALSVFTGEHKLMVEIAKEIKNEFDIITVFGGPHVTFNPEIIEEEPVDFVIVGEGEYAFAELVNNLESGKSTANIKNVWLKKNGKIIKNQNRELIADLDMLPFSDRELFYNKFKHLSKSKKKYFMVGRGCVFKCTYCFNHIYNDMYKNKGSILRHRSVKSIIAEIKEVKSKYPLKFLYFYDDDFIGYETKWVEEFLHTYKEEINLPFCLQIRLSNVTEDIAIKLKEAGCYCVSVGLECGDPYVRNKIFKRRMSDDQMINDCRLLKKQGIKIFAFNIVGNPVENPLEVDMKTFELNVKCKVDYAWSSILYPYSKTEIADYCIKNGYLDENPQKLIVGNKIGSILKFKTRSEYNQIVNFHKLFGIGVEFPFLLPLIKLLIKLPQNNFYNFLFFLWYGYCFEIKMTPFSIFSLKHNLELIKSFTRLLKQINKTIDVKA